MKYLLFTILNLFLFNLTSWASEKNIIPSALVTEKPMLILCPSGWGAINNRATMPLSAQNARATTQIYPTDRTFTQLKREFPTSLDSFLKENPEIQIFDSGGGFSIYGIELAHLKNFVTSANAQDLWQEVIQPLTDKKNLQYLSEHSGVTSILDSFFDHNQIFGVEIKLLEKLRNTYKLPLPRGIAKPSPDSAIWEIVNPDQLPQGIADFAQSILDKMQEQEKAGRLIRKTGLSQEILAQEKDNSFKLVIDLYGAFYYSADRLRLLELFFAKLKPNGKAFIKYFNINDTVRLKNGYTVTLIDYLTQKFPHIFQASLTGKDLYITKPATGEKLPDFSELLEIPQKYTYHRVTINLVIPSVVYKEK